MAKKYNGGIALLTGFKIQSEQPVSDYMVVELISDLTNLSTLPNQFTGMTTFVLEDQNSYVLKNTGWSILGGGSSFTGGTVSGATNFTGGLTANTISATSISSVSISATTISATTFTANTETIIGRIPTSATGTVPTDSTPQRVYVQGRYAYITNYGSDSLQIFDVSNPSSPVSVSTVTTGSNPTGLYAQGKYVYVTNNVSNILQIFDVSNPSSPSLVGSVSTGSSPGNIYVQGRYAYVTNYGSDSLQIFDVSNPSSPSLVGSVTTGASSNPVDVYVQGRYAYVTNVNSNTLQIFDVSNPSSPVSVGTVLTDAGPYSVYVQGRYAYVVISDNLLQIFDISNPSSPSLVGSVTTGTSPFGVYVQGRYAYVTNLNSYTLQIFDVSSPSSPVLVGTVSTGEDTTGLYVQGRYAYVVNSYTNTLQIFDVGGSYIQQLEAGGILTNTLESVGNATIGNNLAVVGGLNVSQSANILGNLSATNMRVVSGLTVNTISATSVSASTYQNLPISLVNTTSLFSTPIGAGEGNDSINCNFFGRSAGWFEKMFPEIPYTGSNNSNFFGFGTGGDSDTNNDSNYFGYLAGEGSSGSHNSNFFGASAGWRTSASYSNFFGASAGTFSQTSYSTLIGYKVGSDYTNGYNSIGSNNIIIGTNISLTTGATNSINLGGVLFGTGTYSVTTGNPSITGQTNGRIGINVVNPLQTLHVSGGTLIDGGLTANTLNIRTLGGGIPINNLGIDSSGNIVTGTSGGGSTFTGGTVTGPTTFTTSISAATYQGMNRSFGVVFDGGGTALIGGTQSDVIIPYSMIITSWTMISDVSGSTVIDAWKNTYTNYPPVSGNTITGSALPTITSSNKGQSSSVSSWITTVTSGDIIRFNVNSATDITKVTLTIQGYQTL